MSKEIPLKSDDIEALSKAIGSLIIAWSLIESILDIWQTIINKFPKTNIEMGEMGRLNKYKIKFIRENISKIDDLSSYNDIIIDLLNDIELILKTRNTISHCYPSGLRVSDSTVIFRSLELVEKKTSHRVKDRSMHINKICKDAILSQEIYGKMLKITNEILDKFFPDYKIID
ncbi:hypothetical protein [Oceanibaculum indicum]|uniref:hypothetical protein n=1 Tax=Oceanibaculum indicum TaxID=526216 RepID=UPI0012EA0F4A|nr:hypothetical protein [Oceanibaculum indicum]